MLDTRRLEVLRHVVDAGSITGAAANLSFTPSAVSQTISALERETGIALFEKAGRGIRPTRAGHVLAEHADAVLDRLREAEAALVALRSCQSGRLRLAAFATAGASLVPRAMARFRSAHPAVELDLVVAEVGAALGELRAGRIDLAVVQDDHGSEGASGDGLVRTHLLDDPYRVILPADHPLASCRRVSLDDLAGDPWIGTASGRCNSMGVVTDACRSAGFQPHFAIEADEFSTALGFAAAGLGVALVPLLALSSVPDGVRVRPIDGHTPARRIFSVTRAQGATEPPVPAMVEALRDSAGTYLAGTA
jgi:DNA-binding transcriptional LysR family regulator